MAKWRRLGMGLALTVLASSARGGVIVVDSSGGGQFTDLQAAVNFAQEADTLLVKQGAYSGFTIDGKALTVAEDTGATVTVSGTVTVKNLAIGQIAVLSGLTVTGVTTTSMADAPGTGLIATGIAGALRAKNCRFEGAKGIGDGSTGGGSDDCCDLPNHHWGWHAVILDANSRGVAFVGCTLVGGRGANAYYVCYCGVGGPGGDALHLTSGLAALYDCTLVGGRGGDNGYAGGPGGAGGRVLGPGFSGVTASGTTFQGGDGGDGYDYLGSVGGAGGDGLVLASGMVAHLLETTQAGGTGGQACYGAFPPGPDGVGISGPGTPFFFSVPKLVLEAPTVVREMQSFPITVTGRPGDEVYLFVGVRTPYKATASWHGVLLASNPHPQYVAILGEIPASGVLTTGLQFSDLGPSVDARNWFLQVWRNTFDGRTLGSFAPVTVLDSAY